MRILITGAAGFLGSHLCDRMINEGHTVIGMDNLITGSMDNLCHLMPVEQFSFYHHDVTKFVHGLFRHSKLAALERTIYWDWLKLRAPHL